MKKEVNMLSLKSHRWFSLQCQTEGLNQPDVFKITQTLSSCLLVFPLLFNIFEKFIADKQHLHLQTSFKLTTAGRTKNNECFLPAL